MSGNDDGTKYVNQLVNEYIGLKDLLPTYHSKDVYDSIEDARKARRTLEDIRKKKDRVEREILGALSGAKGVWIQCDDYAVRSATHYICSGLSSGAQFCQVLEISHKKRMEQEHEMLG